MKLKRLIATVAVAMAGWSSAAWSDDLLVGAASSLTNAFRDLGVEFQNAHPGTTVFTSFASSDALMQQVVQGAPVDVFASADQQAMDRAEKAQVIDPASRQNFTRNELVMIVPADNPLNVQAMADLARDEVQRVAYGNPAIVPVGRYTRAALERSGHWDTAKRKEVLGQNVRQVLDYVARGEVDAGFVFATDAAMVNDRVKVISKVDTPVPVLYPIALVVRDGRSAQAEAFLAFVMSPQGQAVLARYGFQQP